MLFLNSEGLGKKETDVSSSFHDELPLPPEDGPQIDVVVQSRLSFWRHLWDAKPGTPQRMEFRSIAMSDSAPRIKLEREQSPNGWLWWRLKECYASICNGAGRGSSLKKIRIASAKGPLVSELVHQARDLANTLEQVSGTLLQHGGGLANPGLPLEGMTYFNEAAEVLAEWRRFIIYGHCPYERCLDERPKTAPEEMPTALRLFAETRHYYADGRGRLGTR